MKVPKALLFDFDGLIADTEVLVFDSWRRVYEDFDEDLTLSLWVQCVGSDWGAFDPKHELEVRIRRAVDWRPIDEKREAWVTEGLKQLQPMPGVRDWLSEARSLGIPCAVASSSPKSWVYPLLHQFEIADEFQAVCCLDDTGKAKPDPALFLLAAQRLSVLPEESLVLEDSLNGLRAAQAAGCPCVVVPSVVTEHLDFQGALARIPSLQHHSLRDMKIPD